MKGVLSIGDSERKKEWVKEHTTVLSIRLNNNMDRDIIQKLENVPNKAGYVKGIIRDDIAKTQSNKK